MSNVLIEENDLIRIANSIRNKKETNQTYKVSEMDDAINNFLVIRENKWTRPATWPDYSQIDLTDQEVIYLTYDTTVEGMWISVRAYGDYTIARGSLSNGVFTAVDSTDCSSGSIFKEELPTNEGDYIVYRITPQSGSQLTRFAFARRDDVNSTIYYYGQQQPCIERYCRLPNWVGTRNRSDNQYVWTTRYMIADTVIDATPTGSFANAYNDGNQIFNKIDLSTCSFSEITSAEKAFYAKPALYDLVVPNDLSSLCTNLSSCFYQNIILEKLDLSNWDTSSVTTFLNMFYQDNLLNKIEGIENFDVSSATSLAGMFRECSSLQKLDLSKWRTSSSLTTIAELFYNCRSLIDLDLSGFNVSNVTTLASTFYGAKRLKTLDLTNWAISNNCKSFSNTFAICNSLKTIIKNLNWNTSEVTTFERMFGECRMLENIDISDFDFSKATTIRYMFLNCNNLANIKASLNLTKITARANVGDFLAQCWKLKDLSQLTFSNCSFVPSLAYDYNIEQVVIPSTVTALGDSCLRDLQHCKYLDFTNLSAVPTLGAATDITNGYNNQIKIFVPDNLFETWLTTSPWNNGTLVDRTFTASDFALYNSTAQNVTKMDLSEINWARNYSYTQNAAIGTAYANMINAGTIANAKRIISGLIDFPSDAESICISVNPEYAFTVFLYDENGNYLKHYVEWNTAPYIIHPSEILTTKKFAIVLREGDGTNFLYAEDWENSGLAIKYVPVN